MAFKQLVITAGFALSSAVYGNSAGLPLRAETFHPVPLELIKATADNGGINPRYKGLKVSGRVLVGSNPCRAQGVVVHLQSQPNGEGAIEVSALRDDSRSRHRFCTMEYNPQFKYLETRVVYDPQMIQEVIILNAEHMGVSRSAYDFMVGA